MDRLPDELDGNVRSRAEYGDTVEIDVWVDADRRLRKMKPAGDRPRSRSGGPVVGFRRTRPVKVPAGILAGQNGTTSFGVVRTTRSGSQPAVERVDHEESQSIYMSGDLVDSKVS